MLAGSHTINVWYADPSHYRLAMPQSMSESDVIRNGGNLWLWGSSANLVTHLALPPGANDLTGPVPAADAAAGRWPGAHQRRPHHDAQRGQQRDGRG